MRPDARLQRITGLMASGPQDNNIAPREQRICLADPALVCLLCTHPVRKRLPSTAKYVCGVLWQRRETRDVRRRARATCVGRWRGKWRYESGHRAGPRHRIAGR